MSHFHCSVNGCNGFQCKERLQEKCVAISSCHCLEYVYLLEDLICSERDISALVKIIEELEFFFFFFSLLEEV